ncbi:MAG TPA: sigma-70 family RNA polymerase sigma factor [Verrucomicrobiae bacterium]|nr:sigma-70 family RNA polymerase sigma factor [Verrucomicrobiae bacterium]
MNAILEERRIGPSKDVGLSTFAATPDRSSPPLIPGGLLKARVVKSAQEIDLAPIDSPRGDTYQLYLREIGQVKLLTPEEEIALAERIQRGDQEAREQMIKANLRLVVKIARDYEGLGLPLLDLISEGNIGLMKGVERFQPARGAKLSTYAAWWVKQSIKRALANQSKTIRLPVHVTQKVAYMRRAAIKLRGSLDREATDQELADELELSPRHIRQYREASRALICLDSPISSDDSTLLIETLADENAAAPFNDLVNDNDHNLVHEALATLDPRESKILAMRFGLNDGRAKTLEEVAEHFGVTRERIRQIQGQALEKMRERIEERDPLSRRLATREITNMDTDGSYDSAD